MAMKIQISKLVFLLLFLFFVNCDEEKGEGFKHPAMSAMESKDDVQTPPILCEKKFKELQFKIGEFSGSILPDGTIKGKLPEDCEFISNKWKSEEDGNKFSFEIPEDMERECDSDSMYQFHLVSCTEGQENSPIMEFGKKDVDERIKYSCSLEETGENLQLICVEELPD